MLCLGAVAHPAPQSFTPTDIGSKLYAWGWAGVNGENVTLVDGPNGKLISFMQDLSGNGNTFFRNGGSKPAYQVGLTLPENTKGGAYSTTLPLIGLDKYVPGQQIYGNIFDFTNPLVDSNDFYLAAVYMNTRTGGQREVWGNDAAGWVRIDQQREQVSLNIGGTAKQISLATQQQRTGTEQVVQSTSEIAKIAKSNVAGAGQTTSSTVELAKLADELRQTVSQFQLGARNG